MSESKQYTTDELIYRFQIGGGKVEEHLRRQDVALAELTRAHAEAAAHYAQVVGERDADMAEAREILVRYEARLLAYEQQAKERDARIVQMLSLLQEVTIEHRDDSLPNYNECEKDPCHFCDLVAALAQQGGQPQKCTGPCALESGGRQCCECGYTQQGGQP